MADKQDRSVAELLSELGSETATLVRQEVALARVELSEKLSKVGKNVGYLAAGGFVLYAGVLAVLAGIIILLAGLMPWWAAAIVVGVATIIVGALLVSSAMAELKKTDLAPRQTIDTLKEDAQWAKDRTK